jgi:hypothetical protein
MNKQGMLRVKGYELGGGGGGCVTKFKSHKQNMDEFQNNFFCRNFNLEKLEKLSNCYNLETEKGGKY